MKIYENEKEQRFVEEEERAKEKRGWLKKEKPSEEEGHKEDSRIIEALLSENYDLHCLCY